MVEKQHNAFRSLCIDQPRVHRHSGYSCAGIPLDSSLQLEQYVAELDGSVDVFLRPLEWLHRFLDL